MKLRGDKNRVELIGTVETEPKRTNATRVQAMFRLVTVHHLENSDGSIKASYPETHDIYAHSGLAKDVLEQIHKGMKIEVEGRLQYNKRADLPTVKYATITAQRIWIDSPEVKAADPIDLERIGNV